MKISAHFALWGSVVFSLVCLYVAWSSFSSIDPGATAQAQEDGRGFAWFWLFLAGVGVASGLASWWMLRHDPDRDA